MITKFPPESSIPPESSQEVSRVALLAAGGTVAVGLAAMATKLNSLSSRPIIILWAAGLSLQIIAGVWALIRHFSSDVGKGRH
jgi:uncharacterized membrane protein